MFLLDVAPLGKRATTLGIDIIGELLVKQPKNESPARWRGFEIAERCD
jgi:hypothetical protein